MTKMHHLLKFYNHQCKEYNAREPEEASSAIAIAALPEEQRVPSLAYSGLNLRFSRFLGLRSTIFLDLSSPGFQVQRGGGYKFSLFIFLRNIN